MVQPKASRLSLGSKFGGSWKMWVMLWVVGLSQWLSPRAMADNKLAPEITLDELKQVVTAKSATIIDVNGTSSYKSAHIPGAINFETVEDKMTSVLPKDKNSLIVAYCGGPMCSAWEAAAKKAKSLGYNNIKHYKGGIKVWKDSGQTIEKGT